jgi:hypothetical protein
MVMAIKAVWLYNIENDRWLFDLRIPMVSGAMGGM